MSIPSDCPQSEAQSEARGASILLAGLPQTMLLLGGEQDARATCACLCNAPFIRFRFRSLDRARAGISSWKQKEHGLEFPLHHGNAEEVPYPDESFDFAISEYGACLWADPYRWVPEAARLLRPGGRLAFLSNSFLLMLCSPDFEDAVASDQLQRPAFGVHRMEWEGDSGTEFHLSHGDWIRLLRGNGFEIEDLVEVRPPETATKTRWPFVTLEWAKQWPCEEVWKARKVG